VLFDGGFTFPNFLTDVFALFIFVLWFWLLVTVASDLFRRDDVSGLAKVLWVILLIVLPYVGIFAYMLTQGRGMTARHDQRAKQSREALQHAMGLSVADEIEKLGRLKASGTISDAEYARLKARLVE
jgi:hypothetical protein